MIPRTIKRYSSSNSASASARAGIKNLLFTSTDANGLPVEEASYATKTFEDGDASPMSGTPLSSRRSSLSSAAFGPGSRRDSTPGIRSSLIMSSTPTPTDSTISTPSSARAFSHTAPVQSEEHGSYQFSPKELAAVKRRVEEEFALKSVTRSPLQSRRPSSKVPFESTAGPDGLTRHPSGFVVPSPGPAPGTTATDLRSRPAELPTRGVAQGVRTFADLKEMATTEQWTRSEKVPQEVRVADGRVEHPSGFVPPTPQHPGMEEVKGVYKPAVDLGVGVGVGVGAGEVYGK